VSRQAHGEEIRDGREEKPKPYEVGLQISRGVYPELSAEGFVQGTAATHGRSIPAIGKAEGKLSGRRASDA
jgi:hypothetical protein